MVADIVEGMPIVTADPDDKDLVCGALGLAFAQGPVAEWLAPDPTVRDHLYRAYAGLVFDQALRDGRVVTTGHRVAAAVWFPTSLDDEHVEPSLDRTFLAVLQDRVPVALADELQAALVRLTVLDDVVTDLRPSPDHAYLAFLGVHPAWQGHGLGGRLLRHEHQHLDEKRRPAFLVATSPRSHALYERHGYRDTINVRVAGQGPVLWGMWREPANAGEVEGSDRVGAA